MIANVYVGSVRHQYGGGKYGVVLPELNPTKEYRASDWTLDTETAAGLDGHVHGHASIGVGEQVVVLDVGSGALLIVGRKV